MDQRMDGFGWGFPFQISRLSVSSFLFRDIKKVYILSKNKESV